MTNNRYEEVAQLSQLPVGKTLCVERSGREILLCRTQEGVFAVDNLCTHAAARLCEGRLKGQRIVCPLHGAAFDVRDGSALTAPAVQALGCYAVNVEGDSIQLALPGETL
ncbi:MAG: non-heme iron oxygenase ferredoxin subunit [Halioglobus sp.]